MGELKRSHFLSKKEIRTFKFSKKSQVRGVELVISFVIG